MFIGWLTCNLEVLLPHSLCRSTTANAPANRQMPIASVVMANNKKKMRRYLQILFFLALTIQSYSQEENRWFIKKENGNFGFIDSLGNEMFSNKFDMLSEHYSCGLVLFKKDSKYGYLDLNGNIISKPINIWGSSLKTYYLLKKVVVFTT